VHDDAGEGTDAGSCMGPCLDGSSGGGDAAAPNDAAIDRSTTDAAMPTNTPIQHVVVIVKENHTFDNYFGTFPGAEGTTQCKTKSGMIACPHAPDRTPRDLCHAHDCALTGWNQGAMDAWDDVSGSSQGGDNLAYAQYLES